MSIELTVQQQLAILDRSEFPPRVFDPRTNETYVLVPVELFERVREFLEKEDEIESIRETYPLIQKAVELDGGERRAKESA